MQQTQDSESANTPRTSDESPNLTWQATTVSLLTSAFWGGTPVAISYTVDELPPVAVAAIRFALAAAFMWLWCRWEKTPLGLSPDQRRPCLILGLMLFVQISTFHWGIAESSSSHASVLINTFVLWVAAIEHFVTRAYRLSGWNLLGLGFAAAGGLIAFFSASAANAADRDPATLFGDLILIFSGFALGVKIVYTKHALKTVPPGALIFWHDVIGVAAFTAWSFAFESVTWKTPAWPTVWGILYQGLVVAGFCFAAQAVLLRKYAASKIAIFSVATPMFGILFAAAFRGDTLSPWLLAAGVCVAIGIACVNLPKR